MHAQGKPQGTACGAHPQRRNGRYVERGKERLIAACSRLAGDRAIRLREVLKLKGAMREMQDEMLDVELVKRWIEALESGKYAQGYGQLVRETPDGLVHCCLGVACEVLGLRREGGMYMCEDNSTMKDKLVLELQQRLGLQPKDQNDLVWLNDGCHKPFPFIAAQIRRITHVDQA